LSTKIISNIDDGTGYQHFLADAAENSMWQNVEATPCGKMLKPLLLKNLKTNQPS
jgi:hypothetical protein